MIFTKREDREEKRRLSQKGEEWRGKEEDDA